MKTKQCRRCQVEKPLTLKYFRKSSSGGFLSTCRKCYTNMSMAWTTKKGKKAMRVRQNKWAHRLKEKALNAYGGKCVCCGETEHEFLTLDHKNGGGSKHRSKILGDKTRRGNSTRYLLWLKRHKWPKYIQVLCWNCNCGREINGGICPHKEKEK